MSITKTIPCKYCRRPVTGELVTDESVKKSKRISQILGTIASVVNGNPIGAYRHVTGKREDSIQKVTAKLLGGGYYYFKCPNCGQDFIKRVY